MVNGKWLMQNHQLNTLDEDELIAASQEYAKKIDLFLMNRETSVLSKLIAIGGTSEEESFEIQAKVRVNDLEPIFAKIVNSPEVEIVRKRHYKEYDDYFFFTDVEQGMPTAEVGRWVKGPGQDFFDAIKQQLGDLPIIAEDLGAITPDVVQLRDENALPGMKIFQFSFSSTPEDPFLPHNYPRNCVAYTGTHDNDTSLGWYESAPEEEKDLCRRYLARSGQDISWDLIRGVWSSVAMIAPSETTPTDVEQTPRINIQSKPAFRVLSFALRRFLAIALTIFVGIFIIVVLANHNGGIDKIIRSEINQQVAVLGQNPYFHGYRCHHILPGNKGNPSSPGSPQQPVRKDQGSQSGSVVNQQSNKYCNLTVPEGHPKTVGFSTSHSHCCSPKHIAPSGPFPASFLNSNGCRTPKQ